MKVGLAQWKWNDYRQRNKLIPFNQASEISLHIPISRLLFCFLESCLAHLLHCSLPKAQPPGLYFSEIPSRVVSLQSLSHLFCSSEEGMQHALSQAVSSS